MKIIKNQLLEAKPLIVDQATATKIQRRINELERVEREVVQAIEKAQENNKRDLADRLNQKLETIKELKDEAKKEATVVNDKPKESPLFSDNDDSSKNTKETDKQNNSSNNQNKEDKESEEQKDGEENPDKEDKLDSGKKDDTKAKQQPSSDDDNSENNSSDNNNSEEEDDLDNDEDGDDEEESKSEENQDHADDIKGRVEDMFEDYNDELSDSQKEKLENIKNKADELQQQAEEAGDEDQKTQNSISKQLDKLDDLLDNLEDKINGDSENDDNEFDDKEDFDMNQEKEGEGDGEDSEGDDSEYNDTEDESESEEPLIPDPESDPSDGKESNSDRDVYINPFADEEDFDMSQLAQALMGGSGKMPKEATPDVILKILDKLDGDARKGAIDGLKQVLKNRGVDLGESLTEAINKSLWDMTDDEYADEINDIMELVDQAVDIKYSNDIKDRIKKINDDANDPIKNRELEREDNVNLQKDFQKKRAQQRELDKYSKFRGISDFKINFWRAIKDQVDEYEEEQETWLELNRHNEDPNVLKKGNRLEDVWMDDQKPSIDLYFDRSGSWDHPEDIKTGNEVVATLKEFKDRDEIDLNVYYFSETIHTTPEPCDDEGGTYAWADIIQNIKANNTKNVVLMTDTDMAYQAKAGPVCKVDGCVWFIWRDGKACREIVEHLIGRQGNAQYSFKSNPNNRY